MSKIRLLILCALAVALTLSLVPFAGASDAARTDLWEGSNVEDVTLDVCLSEARSALNNDGGERYWWGRSETTASQRRSGTFYGFEECAVLVTRIEHGSPRGWVTWKLTVWVSTDPLSGEATERLEDFLGLHRWEQSPLSASSTATVSTDSMRRDSSGPSVTTTTTTTPTTTTTTTPVTLDADVDSCAEYQALVNQGGTLTAQSIFVPGGWIIDNRDSPRLMAELSVPAGQITKIEMQSANSVNSITEWTLSGPVISSATVIVLIDTPTGHAERGEDFELLESEVRRLSGYGC